MKKSVKRPSKYDEITRATQQNYSHQNSARISARRNLLQFEVEQIENELTQLTAAASRARERKANATAQILGLTLVLEKR